MACTQEHFGCVGEAIAAALINEEPLILAQHQIVGISDRVAWDDGGRERTDCAAGAAQDGAQLLHPVVAGEEFVAGPEILDRALAPVAQGDRRPAGEAGRGDFRQPDGRGIHRHADQRVVAARLQRVEGQGEAGAVPRGQEHQSDLLALGREKDEARFGREDGAGGAGLGALCQAVAAADAEHPARAVCLVADGDGQAHPARVGLHAIGIAGAQFVGMAERVAQGGAGRHAELRAEIDVAGKAGGGRRHGATNLLSHNA